MVSEFHTRSITISSIVLSCLLFSLLTSKVIGSPNRAEFVPALQNDTRHIVHNKYGHLSDRCYNQFIKNYIFNQTILSFDKRTMILGCYSGTLAEIQSCHDRMETQFRKSTFKECSYSDQCLLFGDNPSLFFNLNSDRALRSGKAEYSSLLSHFPSKCSQTIVESLIGREAIVFFFKQSNVSIEHTKEMVKGFFKENLQKNCGNFTDNAGEALRLLVSDMPGGMYFLLSLLEFKEIQDKTAVLPLDFFFGFSSIISLIICSIMLLNRKKSEPLPTKNTQQEVKLVQIMKTLFLQLEGHDQNISLVETLIQERIDKNEQLKEAVEDQENRICELTNDFNRVFNDSKAKDNTISKTMDILNEVKDLIQSEMGREPLDVLNLSHYLKQLFKEKSEVESINKEKRIKALTEKNEIEIKYKELSNRMDGNMSETEELKDQICLLEESVKNQKSIIHSLEDSAHNQTEQIRKLLHSLKMKEDQEQKQVSAINDKMKDIAVLEKHLNQIYTYFGVLEEKKPDTIYSVVENLRNESNSKSKELNHLQEQIVLIEERLDEKLSSMLQLDSKIGALQDDNNNLRSQLTIALKKVDSKHEKNSEAYTMALKELEISKKDNSRSKEELIEKSNECKSLELQLQEEIQQNNNSQIEIEKLVQHLEKNKEEIEQLSETNEKLKKSLKEIEEEISKKEEYIRKYENLKIEHSQTLNDVNSIKAEFSSYKLDYQEKCDHINKLVNENSIMGEKIKGLTQLCGTVSERKSLLEDAKVVLEGKNKKVEELTVMIEILNETLESKNLDIVSKEEKIEELLETINQIKSLVSYTSLERNINLVSHVKEMIEQERTKSNDFEIEIQGLKGTLESKSQLFNEYQHKIDEVTELLDGRTKKIDELDIELQFLRKEKKILETEMFELKKLVEEKDLKIKELSNGMKQITIEKLSSESSLNDEIESLSNENNLMKEKIDRMSEALSKKVNKIDDAFNYIQVLNSESENLSSLNKAMEDKYMKALFEKKQFNEQKEKYERVIESLKSQNEKLLDELNSNLKLEKSNKNNPRTE